MAGDTLIVPGFRGSGPSHWQTWMEGQLPGAGRVSGIDWNAPVLGLWVAAIRAAIEDCRQPVWLVAHSYGCLATMAAGAGLAGRIAGALLVAPADPERFSPQGVRDGMRRNGLPSLAAHLPSGPLPFPSLLVASRDDPWMRLDTAERWAGRWGSALIDIGHGGHINVDSGFGPWPQGLALFRGLRAGCWQRRSPGPTRQGGSGPRWASARLGQGSG